MMMANVFRFYWIFQYIAFYFWEIHFYLTYWITLKTQMISNNLQGNQKVQFLVQYAFLSGNLNQQLIQFILSIDVLFFTDICQAMQDKMLFNYFFLLIIFNILLNVPPIFLVYCPWRDLLIFHIFINLIIHSIAHIKNQFQFLFILLTYISISVTLSKNENIKYFLDSNYKKIITLMGGICAEQNISKLEQNTSIFMNSIKYYDSEREPISKQVVDVYSYKTIFIQRKDYKLGSKNELIKMSAFLAICARCPAGVQPIFHIHSQRDIKFTSNYSISLYAEHLNFSFKSYLDSFRAKGVTLSTRQIFYVLRQMVRAGSYLGKKRLSIKSFDPGDLYVSSTYQIKIPIQNIIGNHQKQQSESIIDLNNQNEFNREVLYLSPENNRGHFNRISEINRVFSLGILIMQCCTMLDGAVSYYNYNSRSIDINKLNNDIKSVKDATLAGILSRMLQIDYNKRIKFREIQAIISKLDESMFVNYLLIQ